MNAKREKNVLGGSLAACCRDPVTGFFRDGFCHTGPDDVGEHVVCALMTDEFLLFSKESGNDLSTPRPEIGFPGLKDGDYWCLCLDRWVEAYENDMAPPVCLEATHENALRRVSLGRLMEHALDPSEEGKRGGAAPEKLH